jgi:serine/threonine-protein kinase mTOR
VEALISINNQLRQPEAAVGILTVAQRSLAMDLKVHPCFSQRP